MTNRIVTGISLALVLAVLLNIGIYLISQQLNVLYAVSLGGAPTTVSLTMIMVASAVAALLAGVGVWILDRLTTRPLHWFVWFAAGIALLSLLVPYQLALDSGSFAALGLAHVAASLAIVFGIAIQVEQCETCN